MAYIIYHVQLIVAIMFMCTQKAVGSHRSLLTLFRVNDLQSSVYNS